MIARAGTPVAKLVPYTGDPLRPGLIRTHVLLVEEKVADPPCQPYEMSSSSEPSGSRK